MKKNIAFLFLTLVLVLTVVPLYSAGVGLRWEQETALVPENSDVCLTYGVYNPWPKDSYVKVQLSESLQEIIISSDNKVDSIPRSTFSNSSIPVRFCFKTPSIYKKDCLLLDSLLCSQSCEEEMKIYEGRVEVVEVSESQLKEGGSGGSATTMTVSAPLRVKVQCIPYSTDYSLVYIVVGAIALIILAWRIYKRKSKVNSQDKIKKKK
ncbi:hypothetical protein COU58_03125 [Candidatus Pacearchaeota archaeon CG10_big_fil_rev_8_21_14_0_10_32_42]|nr:MAG: hypothetical protein COU58_03125 [Candidatus Pacearchaeota archaeon CG10_big_fil_rev_8_21_14_0_10_32_42]